jgi:hypothetical protein
MRAKYDRPVTIGVAWVRQGSGSRELWIASDSRLSGTDGYIWDSCAKLSTLSRRDAVVGFAGGTQEAFPLMTQMANAVSSFRALTEGILEFFHCIGHLEVVINDMMNALTIDPGVRAELPWKTAFSTGDDTIVLAGYSRSADTFIIRFLLYQPDIKVWKFARVAPWSVDGPRILHVFGDGPSKAQFRSSLHFRLEDAGKLNTSELLDMEPFEVLCDMLALPATDARKINGHLSVPPGYRSRTIGGAPQAIQVLPGASATPMVVRWGSPSTISDYLLGRRLLSYENVDLPLLAYDDGDLRVHAPWHWPQRRSDMPGEPDALTEPPMPFDEERGQS